MSSKNFCALFFKNWKPADIIALVCIIGGLVLKFKGADGVVGTMIAAICFYYFGKKGNLICDNNVQNGTPGNGDNNS